MQRKIGSDVEHFEAIESLANQLGASLQLSYGPANISKPSSTDLQQQQLNSGSSRAPVGRGEPLGPGAGLLVGVPAPKAPRLSKMELYNSEQADEVFKEIDELAINVAKKDQRTFTDLVHHLTRHCLTDVEKVRAIFRWITVKNLNTMQFDPNIKADTPLGLLRGIKQGSDLTTRALSHLHKCPPFPIRCSSRTVSIVGCSLVAKARCTCDIR